MGDYLIVVDELVNNYLTKNPKTKLTQNILNIYSMFYNSVPNNQIVVCPTTEDLCKELKKRNVPVKEVCGECIIFSERQNNIKVKGCGDFTNYINCSYVKKHKRFHRDALKRFLDLKGIIMLNNALITDKNVLKNYI